MCPVLVENGIRNEIRVKAFNGLCVCAEMYRMNLKEKIKNKSLVFRYDFPHVQFFQCKILFISFAIFCLQAHKSELEIELNGSNVEWTEEKSSRKNVFQLNTRSDLQMLFQSEDKSLATDWFEDIKRISESYLVSFLFFPYNLKEKIECTVHIPKQNPLPFLYFPQRKPKLNANIVTFSVRKSIYDVLSTCHFTEFFIT